MVDFKRTNTYLGCVFAQTAINAFCVIASVVCVGLGGRLYHTPSPNNTALTILTALSGLLSLCLFALNLLSFFLLRQDIEAQQAWKGNATELFIGNINCNSSHERTPTPTLSLLGNPRNSPLSGTEEICIAIWRRFKRFVVHLFFRRVSDQEKFVLNTRPVETKPYALTRNLFAVFGMCALVFRAIVSLQQAQNEIGTRMITAPCKDHASQGHVINVLVERRSYPPGASPPVNIDIVASSGFKYDATGGLRLIMWFVVTGQCTFAWSHILEDTGRSRVLELFVCAGLPQFNPSDGYALTSRVGVFRIELRPIFSTPLLAADLPHIWLSNGRESQGDNLTHALIVRTHLPPWELHPGYHVEAEAKLITKRSIKSSIMRDVLLYQEPHRYGHTSYVPESRIDVLREWENSPKL
ncbi:unnamed protein product [Rhizoctonia solani]|uniref:Uncharacterized protein n=1 Tax=Rhizoctonia solani TaxID=456999 RepID=A0A8H2X7P1_9AGAM|nr:unnamed protein product [Rhizoctonia solani]